MNCPLCNGKTKVLDCENLTYIKRFSRKRVCVECGFRFITFERFIKPVDRKKYKEQYEKSKEERLKNEN